MCLGYLMSDTTRSWCLLRPPSPLTTAEESGQSFCFYSESEDIKCWLSINRSFYHPIKTPDSLKCLHFRKINFPLRKRNGIYASGGQLYSKAIPRKVLSLIFPPDFSSDQLCLFTNKRSASLLTLFRSERNEGMNSRTHFEKKVQISHSWTPLELLPARRLYFIKMHETSQCLQQHSGTLTLFCARAQAVEPVGGSGNMLVSCRTSRVRSGSTSPLWRQKLRRHRRKPEG